jgi:outer membrane protein assembly factor BamB
MAVLVAIVASAVAMRLRRPAALIAPAPSASSAASIASTPAPPSSAGLGAPFASGSARVSEHAARMLHGDAHHTHRAHGHAPRQPRVAWTYQAGGAIEAQIVTSPDEQTLYVASLDGTLSALDRSGTRRWSASLGDRVYSTPAVADDGTVYVGSDAQRFFAILPDGHVKWRLETKGDCDTAPVLAKDGTVVVAAGRDVLSVRSGGDVAWRFTAKRKVFASPAIADDGTVVVASQDNHVYALGPHGALVWSLDVGSDVDGSPVILDDGTIAVGTDAGDVVLISAAGTLLSRRALGGFVRGPLSAARNGDVLAGVYGPSPREARLGADGRSVGAFAVPGPGSREFGVHGGALEDDDGALVFGAQDDAVYVVDATGELRWRFVTGGDVDAPATLLTDGSLVVGSDDGKVYLFAGP